MKTVAKKFIPLVQGGPILLKKYEGLFKQAKSTDPCGWIVVSGSSSVTPSDGIRSICMLEGPYIRAQSCLLIVDVLKRS